MSEKMRERIAYAVVLTVAGIAGLTFGYVVARIGMVLFG